MKHKKHSFTSTLEIIGINPFVFIPEQILQEILIQANKQTSPIPIKGAINNKPYKQTLVKYSGDWRLYINLEMLDNSPKRIGEEIQVSVVFDPVDRSILAPQKLVEALHINSNAKTVFEALTKSKQQEIIRYISKLKTEESIIKNVEKAIRFLNGTERFLGRDNP